MVSFSREPSRPYWDLIGSHQAIAPQAQGTSRPHALTPNAPYSTVILGYCNFSPWAGRVAQYQYGSMVIFGVLVIVLYPYSTCLVQSTTFQHLCRLPLPLY